LLTSLYHSKEFVMNRKRTIVNTLDKERLSSILTGRWEGDWPITRLRMLIESSRIVEPRRIPRNVVTMNSRIRIHDPLWESDETFTLTYPDSPSKDSNGDAVSVTSPIGAAIFGSREGDEVRWIGPRGPRRVVVSAIEFQPEREGRYDL
jgi:regulator of nucleoside diphosphate kinase